MAYVPFSHHRLNGAQWAWSTQLLEYQIVQQEGMINQGLVALPPEFSFEFLGDTNTRGKRDGPS